MIEIIIGIIIPIFIAIGRSLYDRHRKLNYYYSITWGESTCLNPEDILRERGRPKYGFHEYYYYREQDKYIKKNIKNDQNVLIIGPPLSGKSRAIYQALIDIKRKYDVIIPKPVDIKPESFEIPPHFSFWKSILVLDDLDKFAEKQNFMYLLQEFLKRDVIIIASCRSGPEYAILCRRIENELCSLFKEPIEMQKISKEEGEKIIKKIKKHLPPEFDGNIGSLFLPLNAMKNRFKNCNITEKGTLKFIQRLYSAGIYKEREIFSLKRIKKVCKRKGIEMRDFEWEELFRELENIGFVEIIGKNNIWVEETYLQTVIEKDFSVFDNLQEMIEIFSNDPEALINIGDRAFDIGVMDLKISGYMKKAIKFFKKSIEIKEKIGDELGIAKTLMNLGTVYLQKGKFINAKKYFKKCLIIFENMKEANSIAETYMNLGLIYDYQKNWEKADKYYMNALKTFRKKENIFREAQTYVYISSLKISQEKYEEALSVLEKASVIFEKLGAKIYLFNISRFKFECYFRMSNMEGSMEELIHMFEIANKRKQVREAVRCSYDFALRLANNSNWEYLSKMDEISFLINENEIRDFMIALSLYGKVKLGEVPISSFEKSYSQIKNETLLDYLDWIIIVDRRNYFSV